MTAPGGADGITPDGGGPGDVTAVGIGARAGVRAAAVRELVARVVAEHGLDRSSLVYATVEARADELRDALDGVRPVAWSADELAAVPVPHPSERVAAVAGTPSVAEAAALLTARRSGGGAELVVPKTAGDGVTVAVARGRR